MSTTKPSAPYYQSLITHSLRIFDAEPHKTRWHLPHVPDIIKKVQYVYGVLAQKGVAFFSKADVKTGAQMAKSMSHETAFTEVEKLLDQGTQSSFNEAYCRHKDMVVTYVNTATARGFCYDHVNLRQVVLQIHKFPAEYRPSLLKHLRRILAINTIEYDRKLIDTEIAHASLWRDIKRRRPARQMAVQGICL